MRLLAQTLLLGLAFGASFTQNAKAQSSAVAPAANPSRWDEAPAPAAAAAPSPASAAAPSSVPSTSVLPATPPPAAAVAVAPPRAAPTYVVVDPATGRLVPTRGQARLIQRPATLPYHEGAAIPPGYVVEESNLKGLVIGGIIPLGILYFISFSVASGNNFEGAAGWLAVPVIGPFGWLAAHKSEQDCYGGACYDRADDAAERTFVAMDGLFQAAGAAMFVTGLAVTRKRLVLTEPQQLYVVPYSSFNAHGLSIMGRF